MRADRLMSLLMLLQTRGRMTAVQLAEELAVSQRTIYRDIEALSLAGVPVYTAGGPGGGCSLLNSYRTNLTGLTEDEVRALFMLSIPDPLVELGVSDELKKAMLKLSAALSPRQQQNEVRTRQRIHLDSTGWSAVEESTPHLQTIHRALWGDRKLQLRFRLMFDTEVVRLAAPYGLVAKEGDWHLVYAANEHVSVQRVVQVLTAEIMGETFSRPADFDLVTFWKEWCAVVEANRSRYLTTVRVAPDLIPWLPNYFGADVETAVTQASLPDSEGWFNVTLPFESFEEARAKLLGFGGAVEVLAPEALRLSVADFAQQIIARYGR